MKLKNNSILKKIGDTYTILPLSDHSLDLDIILKVNPVGAFIYECLKEETTEEEVLTKILAKYEVSKEIAQADLDEFLAKLNAKGLLCM